MANIGRLRNIGAGLLGSFMSRNNRVERWWALGVLYNEAVDGAMHLDLLALTASPPGPAAHVVARNYGEMLRRALAREDIDPAGLAAAIVEIRFGTAAREVRYLATGEPFDCTVMLRTRSGQVVMRQAHERCYRQELDPPRPP
jgi:hypothetical protein